MDICTGIRLPAIHERATIVTKPIIIQKKHNMVIVGCEPASLYSTPPSDFMIVLKKRLDLYYSIPSVYDKNT